MSLFDRPLPYAPLSLGPLSLGLSRRAAIAGAAALVASPALAQRAAAPDKIAVEELMKPVGLPDFVLGKADAPVTIVEYASLTCGHCATFHNKVYPLVKEKYVDTGKARFVLRDFPLDDRGIAAAMLARCAGGDKPDRAYALYGALFAKQEEWAFTRGNAVAELFKVARQAGFTQESFDKCLTDQKLMEQIVEGRERASKVFGVRATPTFFINGTRLTDRSDNIESFDKAIQPLIKA